MALVTAHTNILASWEAQEAMARLLAQAVADGTGKPEARVMATVHDCAIGIGVLRQPALHLRVEILGQEDLMRSERISTYLSQRVCREYPALLPCQLVVEVGSFARTDLGFNGGTM